MKRRLFAILAIFLALFIVSCAEPEAPKFTVTFEGIEHQPVVVNTGEKFKLPEDLPTKEGHSLVIKMGDTILAADQEYEITADTILKCSWEINKWTLTVDGVATSVPDSFNYNIPKTKDGFRAKTVKVDGVVYTEDSIIVTKNTVIEYDWIKVWTLTIDGVATTVDDGSRYEIANTKDSCSVRESVKVDGQDFKDTFIIINKDTKVDYTWKTGCLITFTGNVDMKPLFVDKGATYTIPEDIRKSLTKAVGDDELFAILRDGTKQLYPGDTIKVEEHTELNIGVFQATQGLGYAVKGGKFLVISYDGSEQTVFIPETHEGKTVIQIDQFAFSENKTIEQVILPETLETIGTFAFLDSGLKEISLPNSLKNIGVRAFAYVANLRSITIPGSVVNVYDYAFDHCENLVHINVLKNKSDCAGWDEKWNCLDSRGYGSYTVSYLDKPAAGHTVHFKQIGNLSFKFEIEDITVPFGEKFKLPENLSLKEDKCILFMTEDQKDLNVGDEYSIRGDMTCLYAVMNKCKLTIGEDAPILVDRGYYYEIPRTIGSKEVIKATVIKGNSPVTEEILPGTEIRIMSDTEISFELSEEKEKFTVTFDVRDEHGNTIAKADDTALKGVPYEIPGIPGYYFKSAMVNGKNCNIASLIDVDQDMTLIYENGKKATPGLHYDSFGKVTSYDGTDSDVVIPDMTVDGRYVRRLGNLIFKNNRRVHTVLVPEGVIEIGLDVFNGTGLSEIKLPDSLEKIGESAFFYVGLKKVTIPGTVKYIGETAFGECNNLKEITVLKKKADCLSWGTNWHGATPKHNVTVHYLDCAVTYPETK